MDVHVSFLAPNGNPTVDALTASCSNPAVDVSAAGAVAVRALPNSLPYLRRRTSS